MPKENLIQKKSFDFALSIIVLYKQLCASGEFVMSKQLLRSATSIGANVEEAIAAQSKRDFLSKMAVASKEARESRYWLKLLGISQIVAINYCLYLQEVEVIINILTRIVKTSFLTLIKENPLPMVLNKYSV